MELANDHKYLFLCKRKIGVKSNTRCVVWFYKHSSINYDIDMKCIRHCNNKNNKEKCGCDAKMVQFRIWC